MIRTYLETVLELPWNKMTKDNASPKHAEEILEADHYGLEKVKRARAGIPGSPHPDEEGHQPDPLPGGTAWNR